MQIEEGRIMEAISEVHFSVGDLIADHADPDGGVAFTFDGRMADEAVQLIFNFPPHAVKALRARVIAVPAGIEWDRWTQAEADLRILGKAGGSFIEALIRCIGLADPEHLARLRLGFPQFVDAYERWMRGELRPGTDAR
jgi:hypothetical protein